MKKRSRSSNSLKVANIIQVSNQGVQGSSVKKQTSKVSKKLKNYNSQYHNSKLSIDRGSNLSTANTCESERSSEYRFSMKTNESQGDFQDGSAKVNSQLQESSKKSSILSSPINIQQSVLSNTQSQKKKSQNLRFQKWICQDMESLSNFSEKEMKLMPNPFYFEQIQSQLKPHMRIMLMDWMNEVCLDLHLKRITFHYAIMYTDLFLSKEENVPIENLQLVGVTSLFIAAKMEEIQPPCKFEFIRTTDFGYTPSQFFQMEQSILKTLNWFLYPTTIFDFANWVLAQWDDFIFFHFGSFNQQLLEQINTIQDINTRSEKIAELENRILFFKQANQKSYKRYRHYMQVIDAVILDNNYMLFKKNQICASLLYLIVQIYLRMTNFAMLSYSSDQYDIFNDNQELQFESETSNNRSDYQIQQQKYQEPILPKAESEYLELMDSFLTATLGEDVEQLYYSAFYVHFYLEEFPVNYDMPIVSYCKPKKELEVSSKFSNTMKIF